MDVRAQNPNAATVEDQKRRMFVTVPIEEGERWKFGTVTIEGNVEFDGTTPNIGGPGITKDNSDFTFYGSTDATALTVTVVNSDAAP